MVKKGAVFEGRQSLLLVIKFITCTRPHEMWIWDPCE